MNVDSDSDSDVSIRSNHDGLNNDSSDEGVGRTSHVDDEDVDMVTLVCLSF
jgi:hypothetical protein